MKKIFTNVMLAVSALCMIGLVGCDKPQPPQPENLVELDFMNGYYYMEQFSSDPNTVVYSMLLSENTLTFEQTPEGLVPSGTGKVLTVQLNAEGAGYPNAGTYAVNEACKNSGAVGLCPGYDYDVFADYGLPGVYIEPAGTFVQPIEDGAIGDAIYVTSGEVKVEGSADNAKFTFKLKLADGTDYNCVLSGKTGFADATPEPQDPFTMEPDEAVEVTVKVDSLLIENYGEYYDNNAYDIYLTATTKDERYYMAADFFIPVATKEIVAEDVYGEYRIDDSMAEGTALASDGFNYLAQQPSPTFLASIDGEGYIEDLFYIVSGSIKVEEGKLTANMTSAKGSTVVVNYEGEISVDNSYMDEEMNMVAKSRAARHKGFANDNVVRRARYVRAHR